MAVVELKKHVPSGTIILNRRETRNALSRETMAELRQAFEDFRQERKVRAVILTGAGEAFCSGMDLDEMRVTSKQPDAQSQWYNDAVQYKELLESMLRFPKPIIAAVDGAAVAGGAGLVLASDIVVAGEKASLGFPEPRRGLVAGIVAPLLTFRIGAGYAANLLLSARTIDANEAMRVHLFHELVKSDLVWARANALAQECAKSAPESLLLTKRMVNENIGEHLSVLFSAGAAASATARTTEAAQEGLDAFFEKRSPNWP
ncbi:MAG: enoyl-CoA hydratase/isomerase family protein [Planctomycetaceae bacterium]|nr:enoyl-CoA hydratase/isomerase family protein [Planctomycetales bacterium]MCB9922476.1 enoyl-CoA hydratase/isomerase family protein [Planctomycetaceae bacterium]